MINENKIKELVEQKIEGTDTFLVDVKISAANKISIYIDNDNGLAIKECVEVSRHVENSLNRDEEDFELEVSSPGLDEPLKVLRQYSKRVGKEIEVILSDGKKLTGILSETTNEGIILEEKQKKKAEWKQPQQWITSKTNISYINIKEAKSVIKF